jgi:hypothetical protein
MSQRESNTPAGMSTQLGTPNFSLHGRLIIQLNENEPAFPDLLQIIMTEPTNKYQTPQWLD